MAGRKLNGADLAAELSSLPDREMNPPAPEPKELPSAVANRGADQEPLSASEPQPLRSHRKAGGPKSRGGRPAKAGVDGIPVNVRLSQGDHLALARLSTKLMTPGRPLPTVQDVVRSLLRGALSEPDMAMRLCRKVSEVL